MVYYGDGLIYTIKVGEDTYVGSTTDFYRRKTEHKCHHKRPEQKEYNCLLYQRIRENGGKFEMKLHHFHPCKSKTKLREEEQKTIIELKPTLNERNAYLSVEGTKRLKELHNKKVVLCECGCYITSGCLARHKRSKKHKDLINFSPHNTDAISYASKEETQISTDEEEQKQEE